MLHTGATTKLNPNSYELLRQEFAKPFFDEIFYHKYGDNSGIPLWSEREEFENGEEKLHDENEVPGKSSKAEVL